MLSHSSLWPAVHKERLELPRPVKDPRFLVWYVYLFHHLCKQQRKFKSTCFSFRMKDQPARCLAGYRGIEPRSRMVLETFPLSQSVTYILTATENRTPQPGSQPHLLTKAIAAWAPSESNRVIMFFRHTCAPATPETQKATKS